MPTGYTAEIAKGIDFETFIMHCARAFGALMTIRDDSPDTPIPKHFESTNYHKQEIVKIEKRIAELKTMALATAARKAKKEYQDEIKSIEKRVREAIELQAKYEKMLGEVKAWVPPSSDHIGLKSFMIDQITDSMKFDCNTDFYTRQKPKELTGKEWKELGFSNLLKELAYHTKKHTEEAQRVKDKNHWIKQLRDSLVS